jgi:hypothetical protein
MDEQEVRKIAHKIIDTVELAIHKTGKVSLNSENPTLLHGEAYYDLEDQITQILKSLFMEENMYA